MLFKEKIDIIRFFLSIIHTNAKKLNSGNFKNLLRKGKEDLIWFVTFLFSLKKKEERCKILSLKNSKEE